MRSSHIDPNKVFAALRLDSEKRRESLRALAKLGEGADSDNEGYTFIRGTSGTKVEVREEDAKLESASGRD